MQAHEARTGPSVYRHLPWAAVAFVLAAYLFTLDRAFSPWNLPILSQVNRWDWRPVGLQPLLLLVSYPTSFFPVSIQPLLLSLISCACATGSLALLARTVMILPQERTRLQRQRALKNGGILPDDSAWLPACLAVLVFGLQLTVWQNATRTSTDVLDLLVFAYVVRAIAEFRLDNRDSWLHKAAFVFGLGIVNNFAMIAYFPIFIGCLIWMKGTSFFNASFLIRFALLGCLGLLLYLLIPTIHGLSDTSATGFWKTLRTYLGGQKAMLFGYNRVYALLFCSVSLIPMLGLAFRWGEAGGDVSGASHAVTTWMTHLIAVAFLTLCIGAAFEFKTSSTADSVFSISTFAAKTGNPNVLSVFYLAAIAIGYYSGYLLLIFGTVAIHRWARPSALGKKMMKVVVGLLVALTLILPALLAYRNGPIQAKANGSDVLATLGRRLIQNIPDQSFVISDNPLFTQLVTASAEVSGRAKKLTSFESGAIELTGFHKYQRKQMPAQWPPLIRDFPDTEPVPYTAVNLFLTHLSSSNRVYYSEPSFGYFFEAHYASPTGMVYHIHPLPVGVLDPVALTPETAATSEALWREIMAKELPPLKTAKPSKKVNAAEVPLTIALAQAAYSRSLNSWGVSLQRLGQWDKALEAFTQAVEVNPLNPCAEINRSYNLFARTNKTGPFPVTENISNLLKPYGGQPDALLRLNGPIDEPEILQVMAQRFAEGGPLYLQASVMLRRAGALRNATSEYDLAAARLLSEADRSDVMTQLLEQVKTKGSPTFLANENNQINIADLEAIAAARSGDFAKGESLMQANIRKHPKSDRVYDTLSTLYLQRAMHSRRVGKTNDYVEFMGKAQGVLADQVKVQPTNVSAWVNYGASYMQMDDNKTAIRLFTKAIELDKNSVPALLNRAICHFKLKSMSEAQQDYEAVRTLQRDPPYQVLFGLAEIAYLGNRKKEALELYEEYLKKAPNIAEREQVEKRVKELKK